jgi:hypothetical protein
VETRESLVSSLDLRLIGPIHSLEELHIQHRHKLACEYNQNGYPETDHEISFRQIQYPSGSCYPVGHDLVSNSFSSLRKLKRFSLVGDACSESYEVTDEDWQGNPMYEEEMAQAATQYGEAFPKLFRIYLGGELSKSNGSLRGRSALPRFTDLVGKVSTPKDREQCASPVAIARIKWFPGRHSRNK